MGEKGEVFEWAVRRGRRVRVDGGCGAGGGDGPGSAKEWVKIKGATVDRLGHGRMGVLNEPNDTF